MGCRAEHHHCGDRLLDHPWMNASHIAPIPSFCYDSSMMDENLRHVVAVTMPRLDEKGRRLFLGALACYLGHGGITELSELTGVSRSTITLGKAEAQETEGDARARTMSSAIARQRTEGAGRKPVESTHPDIREQLLALLNYNEEHPLCWTTKSLRTLADELTQGGTSVSYVTVKTQLEELGFSLPSGKMVGKQGADYDAQLAFINKKAHAFIQRGIPVIAVETQNRRSDALETFTADCIQSWWTSVGRQRCREASELFIITGIESSDSFKESLQPFVDASDLVVHVSLLPPCTMRWNKAGHHYHCSLANSADDTPPLTVSIALIESS